MVSPDFLTIDDPEPEAGHLSIVGLVSGGLLRVRR
jgi:hypothetical protein